VTISAEAFAPNVVDLGPSERKKRFFEAMRIRFNGAKEIGLGGKKQFGNGGF